MSQYQYISMINELGQKGSHYGLESMTRLLDILHHPEDDLKIIHVAGTNGKGSTLAFLDRILRESGYTAGRYISPTIQCYEERFQINGRFISEDKLEFFFHEIREAMGIMEARGWELPTLFEAETAVAFLYFREEKVDYALIETGMGGLLDATNVIRHPLLTILTSISEDHKAALGETLEEIALQKAGIIKPGVPVVLAVNLPCVRNVVRKVCEKKESSCVEIRQEDLHVLEETPTESYFEYKGENYRIRIPGTHQMENALTALDAAFLLGKMKDGDKISPHTIKKGLEDTFWPGRLELLTENPPFYIDGAHNPDGARKLAGFLEKHFTNKRIVYIMGVLKDKEYPLMLSYLMPLAYRAYVFTPRNQRGLDSEFLAEAMKHYSVPVTICRQVCDAVRQAVTENADADCFVLCGSLSFIEDFRSGVPDVGKLLRDRNE